MVYRRPKEMDVIHCGATYSAVTACQLQHVTDSILDGRDAKGPRADNRGAGGRGVSDHSMHAHTSRVAML